jgi:NitT/TauT family transport system substrate-binding protein
MARKKIVNEISGVVFSLPWIVARDEGLFAAEDIDVEFVKAKQPEGLPRIVEDHRLVPSIAGHKPFEDNQAEVYRACHWGQIRRSYDSERGGRIAGKRPAIGIQALYSAPGSRFTHPQTLADQPIAVRFHRGSHYATLQMLEGFLKREEIKTVNMAHEEGYEAARSGEVAAVSLMEPWVTLAEKEGFQKIIETHYVGTEIAAPGVDEATWAKVDRALKKAVHLINADKKKYVHYLIEGMPAQYGKLLTPDDFYLPRLRYVDPGPYDEKEFQQSYDWMVSWGLIAADSCYGNLVDVKLAQIA